MVNFYKKYKKAIRVILLLLVLAFLAQFIKNTDFQQIGQYLKKMPFTFIAVLGLSFLAYLSATLAWKLCLGDDDSKVSLGQLFMMRHVGEMLSVFNPTSVVAGETLKAHYLSKSGVTSENGVSSILLSRILIILSAVLLTILSAIYLIVSVFGANENLIFAILAALVMGGFGYLLARFLLHSKFYLARLFKSLQNRFGKKYISDKFLLAVENVNRTSYIFYNHHRKRFILAFVLSIVHWIFGAAEFYIILHTLEIDCNLLNAVAIEMGVIVFKTLGAIVPGQVGIEEYANKIMLGMIGVASNEVWLVVSILRRARQLFWVGIAGLFYWMISRLKMEKA